MKVEGKGEVGIAHFNNQLLKQECLKQSSTSGALLSTLSLH